MNLFKIVELYCNPEMQRRISMALLFAVNNSLIGLARRELALKKKDAGYFPDGTTPGDKFSHETIDANVRDLEMRRARNGAGSVSDRAEAGTSDDVVETLGFTVEKPAELAEKFVTLKTLLIYEANRLIKHHHLNPLQDTSVTKQILWAIDLPYQEPTNKIAECVQAAQGRITIEEARAAVYADWVAQKKQQRDQAAELIAEAESFLCNEIDDTDELMTAETFFQEHLDPLSKLRLTNAVWSKMKKFISSDIVTGKLPVADKAHTIGVLSEAMKDLEAEAKELLDECIPEYCEAYVDRGFAGLPIIIYTENLRKNEAKGKAALLAMPNDFGNIVKQANDLTEKRRAERLDAKNKQKSEVPAAAGTNETALS
jgi:hypothetical protein